MKVSEEYFGVEVTFTDGSKSWFDPCEIEPLFYPHTKQATVDNIIYRYDLEDVISIRKYNLCDVCLFEIDEDGCGGCE